MLKMFRLLLIVALLASVNARSLKRKYTGRIVGGEDAVIETYPYQISIEVDGSHLCGGSIISPNWIVSAGHCFEDLNQDDDIKIRAGATYVEEGGKLHKVQKFIIHEKYEVRDDDVPIYDIALARVAKPFAFGSKRQAIELFKANETTRAGTIAVVTGWGETNEFLYDGQLQSVALPLLSKEKCKSIYEAEGSSTEDFPEGQICAGYYGVGGKDSCQGDSGGPMAIDGRLAGIVSWGSGCADPDFPGVYTEVSHYREWIKKHADV